MLVFRQRNVVQEWAQQIVVTYRYSLLSTWQKPLVTSGAVFLVFVASMIASRLPIGFSNLPKTVAVKDKAKRE
ncbi:hypothetical protein EV182_006881 [Spiromyces aspiralis]|uniref:Uncharacterized protein n=1 Tax=Spiromyces aspiralis TaxID=68401 RepID=A0ACC1H879_9FUNG|nr:hypothetical protein EV182_006881 [Spiromyces aspiralis]